MNIEKYLVILRPLELEKAPFIWNSKKYSELFVVLYVHFFKGFLFAKTYCKDFVFQQEKSSFLFFYYIVLIFLLKT